VLIVSTNTLIRRFLYETSSAQIGVIIDSLLLLAGVVILSQSVQEAGRC